GHRLHITVLRVHSNERGTEAWPCTDESAGHGLVGHLLDALIERRMDLQTALENLLASLRERRAQASVSEQDRLRLLDPRVRVLEVDRGGLHRRQRLPTGDVGLSPGDLPCFRYALRHLGSTL